jgi:two-component system NtrC family sensor kinase
VRLLLEPTPEGIALEVQDNGRGIAAEDLTRIFAPGFTTREEGHGFGLHTAANAAREMGASLTVSSDGPGTGARFRLTLPIAQDAAPAPSPQATHLAA